MQTIKLRLSKEVLTPSITQDFEGVISSASFSFAGNEFEVEKPLSWNISVINGGEGYLFVAGNVEGNLNTKCVRCLDCAQVKISSEIEGYVKIKADAKLPEDVGDDECVVLQDGKFIDVTNFVKAAITLDLPIKPLCSESCEGLFRYCDCDAVEDDDVQHPFEVLKNFEFN